MLKKLTGLAALLIFTVAFAAIDPDIQAIVEKLENIRKNFPQEKIHLHLDKPFYSIGDTIYFKAYLVNAENNRPSDISNILYIDLTNDRNEVRKTLLLPVITGITWGAIELTDTLQEGNYQIRAYTNWMRNFGQELYFNKNIHIGNALNSDLAMSVAFHFDSSGNNINAAEVMYTPLKEGKLNAKEISYSILLNSKEISKGKGIPNNNGAFNIILPQLQKNQYYELVTNITNNKTTITKSSKFLVPSQRHAIQFFPEGGQMISSLPARIGFKALSESGTGIAVSGEVTDESGGQPVAFKSEFAGIGSFIFTPMPGRIYHAAVIYPDGSREKINLPKAEENGYTLAIDKQEEEKLSIRVSSKGMAAKEMILIARCNNVAVSAEKLSLANGTATSILSTDKIPTGITQFTLFENTHKPVAERLVFINHHDHLQINITPDKKTYSKREKVRITVEAKDETGDPIAGTFSVAVTQASLIPFNSSMQTIQSNFLLTSDLKGIIEDPGYYFSDTNEHTIKALDNLLLTQGWRRFTWKDILAGNYPAIAFKEEKSLTVSGKILSSKGVPEVNAKVTLLSKQGNGYVLDTLTNGQGDFIFDRLDFKDDMPFAIRAVTHEGSNDVVIKMNEFSPPVANNSGPPLNYFTVKAILPYLTNSINKFDEMRKNGLLRERGITLKEVTVKAKEITKLQEAVAPSANFNGPGNADQVITYLDLPNCSDLSVCLPGKITGVNFKMVMINGKPCIIPYSTTGMGKPMLVVLDGLRISTSDGSFSLKDLPAGDVQSIEVLRTGAYISTYGFEGSGGVLVITTKRGGIDYNGLDADKKLNSSPPKGMAFFTAKGYTSNREFYAPAFTDPALSATSPDFRNTIYWKPDIVTDEDGKAVIEFYNTTAPGTYNVSIEGMSGDGKTGNAFITYEVIK